MGNHTKHRTQLLPFSWFYMASRVAPGLILVSTNLTSKQSIPICIDSLLVFQDSISHTSWFCSFVWPLTHDFTI